MAADGDGELGFDYLCPVYTYSEVTVLNDFTNCASRICLSPLFDFEFDLKVIYPLIICSRKDGAETGWSCQFVSEERF